MKTRIPESELIINPDGSVFHLHIKPDELADNIILVGDPGRVDTVAEHFEKIQSRASNREFQSATGFFHGKRFTVLSTGIGTDNIDIVLNELDALANIDFATREVKEITKCLNIIRIGTSGGLQPEIPVDSIALAEYSIGLDGLLNFYEERDRVSITEAENLFVDFTNFPEKNNRPYFVANSGELARKFDGENIYRGITISAPGFYGPQGRILRLNIANKKINDKLPGFTFSGLKILNYEMESSAIAGLSALLGHNSLTLCAIIANRQKKEYSPDYKKTIRKLIEHVLNMI